MAVDRTILTAALSEFYDFTGKVVLYAGASGGPLLDPAIPTRKRVFIDPDLVAPDRQQALLRTLGSTDSYEIVATQLEEVTFTGDVVYLEFCLHEMADPPAALRHARSLAQDVVVFDHAAGSPWSFYAAEEALVRRAAEAAEAAGIRRRASLLAGQRFASFTELEEKLSGQGPLAVERIRRFSGESQILIPMPCRLALL